MRRDRKIDPVDAGRYSRAVTALRRLTPLLVSLASILAFLPALDGEYLNFDDPTLLLGNEAYRGLGWTNLAWMFSTTHLGHYMPLTWLSFGLNYVTGGMNPWGYHLFNLLLHAANSALVYLLARRLLHAASTGAPASPGTPGASGRPAAGDTAIVMGAALAALLFAVHPQRAESVGWVTDRATVLSALFYLLAVLAYLRVVEPGDGVRWRWAGLLSLLAFAAALLSKGITMSLPVSLLVLDVYPLRRWRLGWPRLLAEKIPYVTLALLGAALTLVARMQGAKLTHLDQYDLGARAALVGYSLWFYPSRLVWPTGLSPLYEHPLHASVLEWRFLGPALAVVAVTVVFVLLRRRFPGGLAAWVHSAVVVAPVSGIVHSGSQLVSDRYGYLAGLGFVTVIGYGLVWVGTLYRRGRLRRPILTAAVLGGALLVIALGTTARIQVQLWHDSEMLWRWAIDKDPTCALCHGALGAAILEASGGAPERMDEAERYLRRAIALRNRVVIAYVALGTIETDRGHDREAEAALRTYMELAPQSPEGPERLALLFLAQGHAREALPLLRQARILRGAASDDRPRPDTPGSPPAPDLDQAIDLIGHNPRMLQYLGHLLVRRGRGDAALLPLRRAVALMPNDAISRFWLVRAYVLEGRIDQARRESQALQALDPKLAEIVSSQIPPADGAPAPR